MLVALLVLAPDQTPPPEDDPVLVTVVTTPSVSDVAVPEGAVTSPTQVRTAVVRIEAIVPHVTPTGVETETVSGSGFVVDESGLVVTNNHVITGAAVIHDFVSGDPSPRHAYVVGRSECSDLAVLQVEGDGFRHLRWGTPAEGARIFAAGFPFGSDEYAELPGEVLSVDFDGDTT